MKKCIYCEIEKEEKDFSLEHVIPQFLGGSQADNRFKTRHVCKKCNSNLGLFVDAAFEKDFLVYGQLNTCAEAFFDPNKPTSLPLHCMGTSDLTLPHMKDTEICEYWIGPLGEQIFWVRPNDERLYWYSGGNPRTVKTTSTQAYFMFSERSHKNLLLSWLSFRDAFEGRKVKKIMYTEVNGADPKTIGFSESDEVDKERIKYLREHCSDGQERHCKVSMYTRYDHRFLAKIGIGIAYSLFGEKVLKTEYTKELLKALWYKEGDEPPKINGTTALSSLKDDNLKEICGIEYATTITILPIREGVAVVLNINKELNWVVLCATKEELNEGDLNNIENGLCIILFKSINKSITLRLPDLIAHKNGHKLNNDLHDIYTTVNQHRDYFKNL